MNFYLGLPLKKNFRYVVEKKLLPSRRTKFVSEENEGKVFKAAAPSVPVPVLLPFLKPT